MSANTAVVIPATPVQRRARTRRRWWVVPLVVVLLGGAVWYYYRPSQTQTAEIVGQFYTVTPLDLEIKIAKDGELQAAKWTEVDSKVEGVTQIIWLVKEGKTVQKGDTLIKLDSSILQTKKEQMDLDLRRAETNFKIANELKSIQESQNAANKEAAEVSFELAKLEMKQYLEGTYPQSLENARTALKMAQINLKNKEEDLEQVKALYAKGFVTPADVKKSELDVTQVTNDVKKATTALTVLEKYSHEMERTRLKTAVAQVDQRLKRVLRENLSLLAQRNADVEEKRGVLNLYQRQATKLQDQIDACTIKAPEDGLVIYQSSIDRYMREPIQEGTTVRYSQVLMRLPDVRTMKAVLKIQEAQKPKLDVEKNQRAIVKILGIPRPIGATLTKVAVLPDNSLRWYNPDLKEYPVELTLDETPPDLKPGTRVDAEIFIDRFEQVLAVPLSALYTVGRDSYVFVRTGNTVKERKVTLGQANETMVQVSNGLQEADAVLMLQAGQGRLLLEKAGIKVTEQPTSRPSKSAKRRRTV